MILGSLKILKNYRGLSKALDRVIDIVLSKKFDEFQDGLNVIDEDITITKLTYIGKEKDKAIPEEHFNHLDMQILLKGKELCFFEEKKDIRIADEKIKEVAESNKCEALTLQCYKPSLKNVYKKHDFKPVKGQSNLMIKKI